MNQSERLKYLIETLLGEHGEAYTVPRGLDERKTLFRALVNVRAPSEASGEFLRVQGEYLSEEIRRKGITKASDLKPVGRDTYLWKGDITTLECDCIVNAANSELLGCFCPNHGCVDNAIHTFAGVELRAECAKLMREQGEREKVGRVKITSGYNLPCKYVLHTVAPRVFGKLTKRHERELVSCYRACLEAADGAGLSSLAFCCLGTGEFNFPNERAAELAVNTVNEYKLKTQSPIKIVFDVFKEVDYAIYSSLFKKVGV